MTAQELRIGNYVLGQTKQITKVDGFFNENKAIYTDVEDERVRFIIHYLNECEGVELTEEILLKCGFDLNSIPYHAIKGQVVLFLFRGVWAFKHVHIEVKYLHQLQNLYWCLTGKELNIEL